MTGAPRVGDEQLTDWPNHATARDGAPPVLVDDLVADLLDARAEIRALHAHEAELERAVERQRGRYEQEHYTVHELQQRIDKALAGHREYLPAAVEFYCCEACNRASAGYVRYPCPIRTCLTGTENTNHG